MALLPSDSEIEEIKRAAVRLTAKKLKIDDAEWYPSHELLDAINQKALSVGHALDEYLDAYEKFRVAVNAQGPKNVLPEIQKRENARKSWEVAVKAYLLANMTA